MGHPHGWYDMHAGGHGSTLIGFVRKNTRLASDVKRGEARFVLCVRNEDYPAGLELRKVYRVLADERASKPHQLRVIDESGEDYCIRKGTSSPQDCAERRRVK